MTVNNQKKSRSSSRTSARPVHDDDDDENSANDRGISPLDLKLQSLFANKIAVTKPSPLIVHFGPKQVLSTPLSGSTLKAITRKRMLELPTDAPPTDEDRDRYKANCSGSDLLYFRNPAEFSRRSWRPMIPRRTALTCAPLLAQILRPDIAEVHYKKGIESATVKRFINCISPSLRSSLPTHDFFDEDGSHQAQWTMKELQDLYMFAHHMGTLSICDMIMDRWAEELNRPGRVLQNEWDQADRFDILGFDPAFLNYLARHGDTGVDFLTDVILLKGQKGWEKLSVHTLEAWSGKVKEILIGKLDLGECYPRICPGDANAICVTFHHHWLQGKKCHKWLQDVETGLRNPTGTTLANTSSSGTRTIGQINNLPFRLHDSASVPNPTDPSLAKILRRLTPSQRAEMKRLNRPPPERKKHFESDDDNSSSDSDSDSEDEDVNAVTIVLPQSYLRHKYLYTIVPIEWLEEDVKPAPRANGLNEGRI